MTIEAYNRAVEIAQEIEKIKSNYALIADPSSRIYDRETMEILDGEAREKMIADYKQYAEDKISKLYQEFEKI